MNIEKILELAADIFYGLGLLGAIGFGISWIITYLKH